MIENHLTLDEIIKFAAIEEENEENRELMVKVNGHIVKCAECRAKVGMYLDIFDEYQENKLNEELKFEEYMAKQKQLTYGEEYRQDTDRLNEFQTR